MLQGLHRLWGNLYDTVFIWGFSPRSRRGCASRWCLMHCPQPGARSRAATQLPGDTCCCQAALRVSSDGRLGRLWRSCWKRTAHLHAAAHFKGTAGTYAGSTGELGFLALLTCRQLFSLTTHVQTKLYGWEVEEPCYLATSFWTEGWATSQLVELDFVMRL